jgi:BASS family bile acid:Na+ symporter
MNVLDTVRLNFSPESLWGLNVILALLMFGISLELKVDDFVKLKEQPRSAVTGLVSQFLLLPFATFLLVVLIRPAPSIALGMMMVAACPGGNISNFLTHFAKGNTALSVSLTAAGTVLCIVLTPLNFSWWAGVYGPTASMLKEISIDGGAMFQSILTLAGIPLAAGMLMAHYFPTLAATLAKGVKPLSILVFLAFVLAAFFNNRMHFMQHIHHVIVIVFLHNALALATGYGVSRALALPQADQRTIAIETGIQNSGLGLILIFRFFDGLGGMALVAAWWGIWHIVSGLALAWWWGRTARATA